ncbi:MAG: DNA primase [Desulfococcaceae bacterium]
MTRTIPDTTIAKIRQAADLVEIVSESVPLRKAGKDFSGLCPFHAEKTPSFSVSPEKQLFYCFGCGEGGDVFHYVMRREGLSFADALRTLARRYGIEIEDRAMTPEEKEKARRLERMRWIQREAADWFRRLLLDAPDAGEARRYLARRGLGPEECETFGLGFAPDAWSRLLDHLSDRGVPAEDVERAGLALPRKSGSGHYDRFRNRLMFPIPDGQGRIIAFGGRVLDDGKPKYLNSPETELFSKRTALYGYSTARRAARETGRVFVVEGYLDAIALHQFGLPNAVATLGTALTGEHVRLLRSMTERAVLVFDTDEAGMRAAERSVPLFVQAQMAVSVLLLDAGMDPDDFVRKEGAAVFRERANGASEGIPFLAERFLKRHGNTVADKARAATELAPILSAVQDPVARSLYVADVARRIGAPEAALLERMGSAPAAPAPESTAPAGTRTAHMDSPPREKGSSVNRARPAGRRWRLERQIATMALDYPPARSLVKESGIAEEMEDERLREIVIAAIKLPEAGADEISSQISDMATRRLAASLLFDTSKSGEWTLAGCRMLVAQARGLCQRCRRDPLLEDIQKAEKEKNPELIKKLHRERMEKILSRKGCRQPDERMQEAQSDGCRTHRK